MRNSYDLSYDSFSSGFSLNKDSKSPFWFVSFTMPDGRQRRRSTKVPHAGGMFCGTRLSSAQAKKRAMLEAAAIVQQEYTKQEERKASKPISAVFQQMEHGKLGRVSAKSYLNARIAYGNFMAFLHDVMHLSDMPVHEINKAVIKDWVMYRRSQVRYATCRKDMSFLRAAFTWAIDAEMIQRNPCDNVSIPADEKAEKIIKEAFTWEEVEYMVAHFPQEWANAIRCCIGTYGQRLEDVLNLKWDQLDLDARVTNIITGKTSLQMAQPMMPWFHAWAVAAKSAATNATGDAAIYVFPELRLHSSPSREFTALVRAHGIGMTGHAAGGRRRMWHSKTFHMLRSTIVTELHAAGVSEGMAMQLVGHESQDVHRVYLRPTQAQLSTAAANLPEVGRK